MHEAHAYNAHCATVVLPWGDRVLTFRYSGKIYVKVREICEAIGLDSRRQINNIEGHPALFNEYLRVTPDQIGFEVEDRYRDQEFAAVSLQGLFGWLMTIEPRDVRNSAGEDSEVYQRLCTYQEECVEVLGEYWTTGLICNLRHFVDEHVDQAMHHGVISLESIEGDDRENIAVDGLIRHLSRAGDMDFPSLKAAYHAVTDQRTGSSILGFLQALPTSRDRYASMVIAAVKQHAEIIDRSTHSDLLGRVYSGRVLQGILKSLKEAGRIEQSHTKVTVIWSGIEHSSMTFIHDVFGPEAAEAQDLLQFIADRS